MNAGRPYFPMHLIYTVLTTSALLMCFAQLAWSNVNHDSVLTQEIKHSFDLAMDLVQSHPDSTLRIAHDIRTLSEQRGYEKGICMSILLESEYYTAKNLDFEKAETLLDFLQYEGCLNAHAHSGLRVNIGNLYAENELYSIGLKYYQEALAFDDTLTSIAARSNIISIENRALETFSDSDQESSILNLLQEIGVLLAEDEENRDLELEKWLNINRLNLGTLYTFSGRIAESQDILDSASKFFSYHNMEYDMVLVNEARANTFLLRADTASAINLLKESKLIADNLGSYRLRRLIYPRLSQAMKSNNSVGRDTLMQSYYELEKDAIELRDKLVALHLENQSARLEKDSFDKKPNWAFLIGAVMFVAVISLIIRNRRDEQARTLETDTLSNLRTMRLRTEDDVFDFKQKFNKIHPILIDKIQNDHPDLSQGDLLHIRLTMLAISNLDASIMLGVSQDAVKRAKQRLSKKLGLESARELSVFLQNCSN